jgi:hypothetical protein
MKSDRDIDEILRGPFILGHPINRKGSSVEEVDLKMGAASRKWRFRE